jgi:fibrillarin-like rRNA methylase
MTEVWKDERKAGLFWGKLDEGTKRPATKNLAKGRTVYGERIIT